MELFQILSFAKLTPSTSSAFIKTQNSYYFIRNDSRNNNENQHFYYIHEFKQ